MNRLVSLLTVTAASALGACASISDMDVESAREGEPVNVSVTVTRPLLLANVQGVTLETGPHGSTPGAFTPAGSASMVSGGLAQEEYAASIDGLTYGAHRVRATLDFLAGGIGVTPRTDQESRDLLVGAPPGCFDFDDGTTQGWTAGPLVVNGAAANLLSCTDGHPGVTWDQGNNWPVAGPSPDHGALHMRLGPNCIPTSSTQIGGATVWRVNLHSPNLETNQRWQGVSGMTFRIAKNAGITPALEAQPLLRVRRPDGSLTWLLGGATVFESVTGTYKLIDIDISGVKDGWTVVQAVVQLAGEPGAWVPDNRLHLDGVCPNS